LSIKAEDEGLLIKLTPV